MAFDLKDDRYRKEQEEFVSNHGGTTSRETLIAILPNICSNLLLVTTVAALGKNMSRNFRIVLEFTITIIPLVLCCTVLSEHIISVCSAMVGLSVFNILIVRINFNRLSNSGITIVRGRRPFITNFRALTNIITAVCILGVDFRAFPRKFAKTEVYGYSLMDTGVGLFVMANALVAPEARDFVEHSKIGFLKTVVNNVIDCVKSCTPLLILGFARFYAVEYMNYQRHVSEYGVHWNFFVTLAFVKIFTSTITSTINSKYSLISGIWILAMHEYVLNTRGLKKWVLGNAPRDDFISANREGFVSTPGYVGLYLIGVAVGRLIHSTYRSSNLSQKACRKQNCLGITFFGYNIEFEYNESMVLCVKLSLVAAQACAATLFCDSYYRVSRRLANAGYCAWIVTLTTAVLTLLLLIEIITDILIHATSENDRNERGRRVTENKRSSKDRGGDASEDVRNENDVATHIKRTSEINEAVNYNGLAFFLTSNLLTGAVNMSMRTLYVDEMGVVQILGAYMILNISFFYVLYRLRMHIKLF